jgi:predicted transcriptional regulator
MRWFHRFQPQQGAPSGALGPLEAAVMEAVWSRGAATLSEIHSDLGGRERLAFNTVATAAERLFRKGLLAKERDGRAHRWSPRISRHEFASEVSRQVSHGLVAEFGSVAVAEFVDALETLKPDELALLESLTRKARRRLRAGPRGEPGEP